jgi:vacuolar iron transporter family protein
MQKAVRTGISFGLTSGVITTLGLMIGLYSGTNSRLAVIGGIITIAIADALSDSLGIHISEESDNNHSESMVKKATYATFFAKFFLALSFLIPLLLFSLETAIIISIVYGLLVITLLSISIANQKKGSVVKQVSEHIILTLVVIVITYFVGEAVSSIFG